MQIIDKKTNQNLVTSFPKITIKLKKEEYFQIGIQSGFLVFCDGKYQVSEKNNGEKQ